MGSGIQNLTINLVSEKAEQSMNKLHFLQQFWSTQFNRFTSVKIPVLREEPEPKFDGSSGSSHNVVKKNWEITFWTTQTSNKTFKKIFFLFVVILLYYLTSLGWMKLPVVKSSFETCQYGTGTKFETKFKLKYHFHIGSRTRSQSPPNLFIRIRVNVYLWCYGMMVSSVNYLGMGPGWLQYVTEHLDSNSWKTGNMRWGNKRASVTFIFTNECNN